MVTNHEVRRREYLKGIPAAAVTGMIAGCTNQDGGNGNGGGNGGDDEPARWQLGTSTEGSGSFQVGSTVAEYFKRGGETDVFELDAVVTAGTGATYRRLDQGDFEMGGSNTVLLDASPDSGQFEDQPLEKFDKMRQVRGYMTTAPWFTMMKSDAGIEEWSDLEGESFFVSSPGTGTRATLEEAIDIEVGLDNIDAQYFAYADLAEAIRSDRIVGGMVFNVNVNTATGVAQEIDQTIDWEPLHWTDDALEFFGEQAYSQVVSTDTSEWSEEHSEEIPGLSVPYMWMAWDERDNEVIEEFTRLTHEYKDELIEQNSLLKWFDDIDDWLGGGLHPEIPVHEGAYNYYQEIGVWENYDLTPPPEV